LLENEEADVKKGTRLRERWSDWRKVIEFVAFHNEVS